MNSEIFETYAKIIEAKDDEVEVTTTAGNPRNTLSAEEIAQLYGLKIDAPEDLSYDYNMVEIAHPEPNVMFDTYDKVNGLVGNQNENHSLIRTVVNKEPRGLLINKKMAAEELTFSLVRTANMLDQKDFEELMVLADTCAKQVNPISKKAQGLFTLFTKLPMIAKMVGVGLGIKSVQDMFSDHDKGFSGNHEELISELDDLVKANTNFGVGKKYSKGFLKIVKDLVSALKKFKGIYDKNASLINKVRLNDASDILQNQQGVAAGGEALASLTTSATQMSAILDKYLRAFTDKDFVQDSVIDRGVVTDAIDSNKVIEFMASLVVDVGNDVNDVIEGINTYKVSLDRLLDKLGQSKAVGEESAGTLMSNLKQMKGDDEGQSMSDFFKSVSS